VKIMNIVFSYVVSYIVRVNRRSVTQRESRISREGIKKVSGASERERERCLSNARCNRARIIVSRGGETTSLKYNVRFKIKYLLERVC
jgi:hypothetical protein